MVNYNVLLQANLARILFIDDFFALLIRIVKSVATCHVMSCIRVL